jgi:hypothetical protein
MAYLERTNLRELILILAEGFAGLALIGVLVFIEFSAV